jgi:benzoyl-CoA reductase/2-hydroxyglutaryl-CoA dehydratase subunit BcrC/BadD/HgdB
MSLRIFSKKPRAGSIKNDRDIIKPETKKYISENIELNIEVQKRKYQEESKRMINRQLEVLKGLPNRAKSMQAFDENAMFFNKRVGELYNFKQSGGKVVGTLCVSAPVELIHAAGAQPVRLCSGFHDPVFSANELLGEVGLCPLVRSVLGSKIVKLNPYLEMCDLIVSPTTCDGKMKLGEILTDYVPVLMLNVPRVKEGYITHQHWLEEIKFFGRKLEALTGNNITKKSLQTAIEKFQRAQRAWYKLTELRTDPKLPPLWGRDASA